MSASNFNWVCFDCRTTQRRPKVGARVPSCLECGAECFCLGYKVEVPRRSALRQWRQLREVCRLRLFAIQERVERWRVRRMHDLEKEIGRMEKLGANKDRARQINKLEEELAQRRTEVRR